MRQVGWVALVGSMLLLATGLAGRATGAEERPGRVRCHSFEQAPEAEIDTRDGASPLGRWVIAQEDAGWRIEEVELDVAVKASGAVVGFANVCMVPVH